VSIEDLYVVPTISAVFTARAPRPEEALPAPAAAQEMVDDSFTRPAPRP
jgi:hypothetical protein